MIWVFVVFKRKQVCACQVKVAVDDLGLCCVYMTSFQRYLRHSFVPFLEVGGDFYLLIRKGL